MNKTWTIVALIVIAGIGGYYWYQGGSVEDVTGAAGDAVESAGEAASGAVEGAADAAAGAAEGAAGAAADAVEGAADAAAGAVEGATDAAEGAMGAMTDSLLTVEGFDAAKVTDMIAASGLDEATKTTLTNAVSQAAGNPELVAGVIDQIKAALGL